MADKQTASATNTSLPKLPNRHSASHQKFNKLNKQSNIIHRTTSESLRLGGNNNSNSNNSNIGGGGSSISNSGSASGGVSASSSTMSMSSSDKSHLTITSSHHTTGTSSSSSGGNNTTTTTNSTQGGGGGGGRKAKSSFQITSVKVGTRMSADNGDDSNDDLDESHTDDNNSRNTDLENETPSFSDDTSFSREDVFFATNNAIGSAPVIPTSSQYGLAIVAPELGGSGQNYSDVHVSVTDAGINIMQAPGKQDVDLKEINQRNERFKVIILFFLIFHFKFLSFKCGNSHYCGTWECPVCRSFIF
jgi:hypothetical protein